MSAEATLATNGNMKPFAPAWRTFFLSPAHAPAGSLPPQLPHKYTGPMDSCLPCTTARSPDVPHSPHFPWSTRPRGIAPHVRIGARSGSPVLLFGGDGEKGRVERCIFFVSSHVRPLLVLGTPTFISGRIRCLEVPTHLSLGACLTSFCRGLDHDEHSGTASTVVGQACS